MDLEIDVGVRSTFLFVPERYNVSMDLINELKKKGFQIGVHGLKHDGKLFKSFSHFKKRAVRINEYLKSWGTKGFSSPSMHHKLLEIS